MLFLLFESGGSRYVLDVRQVTEVLPLVVVTGMPAAPAAVTGLLNYHGSPVPVIDLAQLTLGRPAARQLSTRIVLVNYPDQSDHPHLLGLIAERATQAVRHEPSEFVASGLSHPGAPYLGPVLIDAAGVLQWIDVRTLLPPSLRDLLFTDPVASHGA